MPYSTSTRCRSWPIDRCSSVGSKPILCRLLRVQDVLGAGDLRDAVALFVDVGQHHADLVDQVLEAAERRVGLLAQARQQVGGGDRASSRRL